MKRLKNSIKILCCAVFMFSCASKTEDVVIPKKFGKLRISHNFLPKNYSTDTSMCGLSFQLPDYATLREDNATDSVCYFTFQVPQHKASVHVVNAQINSTLDLRNNLEMAHVQLERHLIMAQDIKDTLFLKPEKQMYGRVQNLIGNVAEPMHFIITDSTDHFIFGWLIFDCKPNYDSILPALDYVKKDVYHFLESIQW